MNKLQNTTSSCDGFFITGTDTEIGKTYVSGCIAQTLLTQGLSVTVRKPIASGCIQESNGNLLSEDALFLQKASQTNDELSTICPYQFEPAISPQRAIEQSGTTVTINDLYQKSKCMQSTDFTLIEGAGGFLSPLAADGLNADLAVQHELPVILVVGNRLGCINHALLTIEAIHNRNLKLHCMIVNDIDEKADKDNYLDLCKLVEEPVLHVEYNPERSPKSLTGFKIS